MLVLLVFCQKAKIMTHSLVARRDNRTRRTWPVVLLLAGIGLPGPLGRSGLAAEAAPSPYARPHALAVAPALLPLPPGAVEPAGWLRDWAVAAGKGITGHLDEYHAVFHDAWKGTPVAAPAAAADGTGWPLEQCAYWLNGLVELGFVLHDDALVQKATRRLTLVVDGVNRGGTSLIYWKKERPQGFNLWAQSQMGRALVAWYAATGQQRILDALVRAYADCPVPMGPLHMDGSAEGGLCNLDAMVETYSFSGDRRIAERIRAAAGQAEIAATERDWIAGHVVPNHAVGVNEAMRLPVLMYLATGQSQHRDASLAAFRWLDRNHLLPSGVNSGQEFPTGIGAFRFTETCNVEAHLWSSLWMYRILGDRAWGDRIERLFFNAAPAPIARDFQTMSYYQSPNRILAESLPSFPSGGEWLRYTRLGFPQVLCCVASVNRVIPHYVIHMWMATEDGGLAAALYGPCTVSALVGPRVPVKLTCSTAYPFEETIRVTVDPERAASFPLYFRIPAWCAQPRIAINGAAAGEAPDAKGFVRIERPWAKGDRVVLTFPMSVHVARGMETEYPAAVRSRIGPMIHAEWFQKRRFPYASVSYGPLLFALAIPDKDPGTPLPAARWRYALDNAPQRDGADIEVERGAMPAHWDWPLRAPLALQVPARTVDWNPTEVQALPAVPIEGGRAETIRLIPYGCTKFRISMFPVTPRAWGHGE